MLYVFFVNSVMGERGEAKAFPSYTCSQLITIILKAFSCTLKNGGIFCHETLTGALKFHEFPLKLTKDTWTLDTGDITLISSCIIIKHKNK